jgi:hypothetical protein
MQLSAGRRDICREAMLIDFARFGLPSADAAQRYLDELLARIVASFDGVAPLFGEQLGAFMRSRMLSMRARLSANPG